MSFRPDVTEEIRHHIEARARHLVSQGWDPEDAREEAERRLGSVHRVRRAVEAIEAPPSERLAERGPAPDPNGVDVGIVTMSQ